MYNEIVIYSCKNNMLKKYTYRLQGVFAALIQCKGICSEKKTKSCIFTLKDFQETF